MRIFVAGATGAIGRRLVPMLVAEGHEVTAMTRSAGKQDVLRAAGAEPVVCDALDGEALAVAVREARPQAVIHELTALPQRIDPRKIERDFELNDRLRSEGTRNLVRAARAAGVEKIVAQSIAFMYAQDGNGHLHDESDPLLADPPKAFRRSARAVSELEAAVLDAGGTVLRYGYFYGPGTALAPDGSMADQARSRQLPIVGKGSGVWSFVHIDDAARATIAALSAPPGIYNVVDDDPALVRDWVPAFSEAIGAPRPMRVPVLLARLVAGSYGVQTMTRSEGASNARAKRELGWKPQHPSWREGFREALSA